jgi:anoctamin-10
VALYFSFLSSYARALIFPSGLGIIFYLLGQPYSLLYSTLLLLWSITFVEWWTVQERILSVRWGTHGSARVEKKRASYVPGFPWWKRELRMVASIPVIIFFGIVLAGLLTSIFVFEAFVTQLYTGPGHKYIVSPFSTFSDTS